MKTVDGMQSVVMRRTGDVEASATKTNDNVVASAPNTSLNTVAVAGSTPSPRSTAAVSSSSSKSGGNEGASNLFVMYSLFQLNFASMLALFLNKALFAQYGFKFPITLYFVQAGVALFLLLVMLAGGMIPDIKISRATAIGLIPVSIASWLNVNVGLNALTLVNIPMFSALRRLTVVFTMVSEMILLHKFPSARIAAAVALLACGSVMSALSDVTFNALGYALVFANNALTALYLVLVRRALDGENKVSPVVLSLYNFAYVAVPTGIVWVATGEYQRVRDFVVEHSLLSSRGFIITMAMSSFSGFFIVFSTTLATGMTSPLSTVVAAQAKNVIQSFIGLFSWGYVPTPANLVGLMLSAVAQVAFAAIKYRENNPAQVVEPSTGASPRSLSTRPTGSAPSPKT